jgi:hypothetical protein
MFGQVVRANLVEQTNLVVQADQGTRKIGAASGERFL